MQQAFPDSIQLRLVALEQALADSQEREEETRKQLDELIIGFKQLERIVSEQKMYQHSSQPSWQDNPHLPHYQQSSMEKGPEDRPFLILSKHICTFVLTPFILTR